MKRKKAAQSKPRQASEFAGKEQYQFSQNAQAQNQSF